jgi:hypothetical protein
LRRHARPVLTYLPNLLLNKELLLALSYSIFEATRQLSPGGCFPFADEAKAISIIPIAAIALQSSTSFISIFSL